MAKAKTKTRGGAKRERRERRFEPRSSANPILVRVAGALGAVGLGAGAWGQFSHLLSDETATAVPFAPYVLAGGAVLLGFAIWFGTSGEPAVRVGDPGVSFEKSGLTRIPWYGIESIAYSPGESVRIQGKDESGAPVSLKVLTKTNAQAVAWILKEAQARIPDVLELSDDVELPEAQEGAGELRVAEPPQIVGRKCADTGKPIAYEPDARLCTRCGRVYHKAHVPDDCACGASLAHLHREKAEKGEKAKPERDATAADGEPSEAT